MGLSIAIPSRLGAAAAALALAAAGSVALAGAAHAAACLPTSDSHTAAVVLTGSSAAVIGQSIDATGCFYGVYVSPGATDATVSGNTIGGYDKAGVFVDGRSNPTSANVTDNTVDGAGPDAVYAQDGIEFGGANASGLVRGNTIEGHWYSGADWTATGILLFDVQANPVSTSKNYFIDNQKNLALVTSQSCANQLGHV